MAIVFWRGTIEDDRIQVHQLWGDADSIARLFKKDSDDCDLFRHPADTLQVAGQSILSQRSQWISDCVATPNANPLHQRFLVACDSDSFTESDASDDSPSNLSYWTIDESIATASQFDQPSDGPHTILGHLQVTSVTSLENASEADSESRDERELITIAMNSMHQINNDLTVVALAIELVNLKLRKGTTGLDPQLCSDVTQSFEPAKDAVNRAAKTATDTLKQLSR